MPSISSPIRTPYKGTPRTKDFVPSMGSTIQRWSGSEPSSSPYSSQNGMLRVALPYPRPDEPLGLTVGHRHGRIVSLELGTRRLRPEVAEREPTGLIRGLGGELEVGSQVHARKVASFLRPWGWCRSRRWRQRRVEGSEIGTLSDQVRPSWPRPASLARRMACVRSAIWSLDRK